MTKTVGSAFAKRPSSPGGTGLRQHYDGIQVENPGPRGFYFCLMTTKTFLVQAGVVCDCPDGFYWEALILENFSVSNVRGGEAIYIADGTFKDQLLEVVIQNGKIDRLTDSSAALFDHMQLSKLTINDIKLTNVVANNPNDPNSGAFKITNSTINVLKLQNLVDPKIIIRNSTIKAVECWNCKPIFDGLDASITPVHYEAAELPNVRASLAVNLLINGVVYGAECNSLTLKPR